MFHSVFSDNPHVPFCFFQVIHMFQGCKPEDMPPHIYATAQTAYRDMLTSRADQSIVLLGRSGGGKSTNVRHLMHYFVVASGSVGNILTGKTYKLTRNLQQLLTRKQSPLLSVPERAYLFSPQFPRCHRRCRIMVSLEYLPYYIPRRKSGIYWIQVRRAAAAAAVEISLWTR